MRIEQRPFEELRRDLGDLFLEAVADPATVGMLLNADGTLWLERLREPEPWRPIDTMSASRAETMVRTLTAIAGRQTTTVEFRLDAPRSREQIAPEVKVKPLSLECACCRPKPLQAAPTPVFRLCWRKICMVRSYVKNAQRAESRALDAEAQALAKPNAGFARFNVSDS
jgi:hypothetical protein